MEKKNIYIYIFIHTILNKRMPPPTFRFVIIGRYGVKPKLNMLKVS